MKQSTYLCHLCCSTGPGIYKQPAAQQRLGPKYPSSLARQLEDHLSDTDRHRQLHKQSAILLFRPHWQHLKEEIKANSFRPTTHN